LSYTAEISRSNPTAFVFLLDQSSSMREPFGRQPEKSKADGVAEALNRLLQNLVLKCAKADGIRDFFHVGMIRYGGEVASAFGGSLADQTLVPISRIANNPLRVEVRTRMADDGAGGLLEQQVKFPVWYEARPAGKTPMSKALWMAKEYLRLFLGDHPDCFPPLVINITDGQPTDGDPSKAAEELRAFGSKDGNVLLFNSHLSNASARPILFPQKESGLPDEFAKQLFEISSVLPPKLVDAAKADGFSVGAKSRGFVFNADLVAVIRFLDIGTRVAQSVH
jgi:hypothetical protein